MSLNCGWLLLVWVYEKKADESLRNSLPNSIMYSVGAQNPAAVLSGRMHTMELVTLRAFLIMGVGVIEVKVGRRTLFHQWLCRLTILTIFGSILRTSAQVRSLGSGRCQSKPGRWG